MIIIFYLYLFLGLSKLFPGYSHYTVTHVTILITPYDEQAWVCIRAAAVQIAVRFYFLDRRGPHRFQKNRIKTAKIRFFSHFSCTAVFPCWTDKIRFSYVDRPHNAVFSSRSTVFSCRSTVLSSRSTVFFQKTAFDGAVHGFLIRFTQLYIVSVALTANEKC